MALDVGFGKYDPTLCACGCRNKVEEDEFVPRFATAACRTRWAAARTLRPDDTPEPEPLDDGPQEPPPPAEPVSAEEAVEVRQEFAERITVAPAVEAALGDVPPSGMQVRTPPRSLWAALRHSMRKVW
jgi:hypothetical protein